MEQKTGYTSISQRAADSFRRMLAKDILGADAAERDVRAFWGQMYEALYKSPERFGLPLTPDLWIAEDEPNAKERKQAVLQKIKKPRTLILQGLEFLRLAGLRGHLENGKWLVPDFSELCKEAGVSKKFLDGLAGIGLAIIPSGEAAEMTCQAFPAMPVGLSRLAQQCSQVEDERLRAFCFARCDFKVSGRAYQPAALDLYAGFDAQEAQLAAEIHRMFIGRGFQTILDANGPFAWVVKYQGDRKVKGTPFFEVQYEERYADPMRLNLKCASTNRLIDLLPLQAESLQADFVRRVYPCNGDRCNWCRNQKTLGPSVLRYGGSERVVCWYSNGDIQERDAGVLELIGLYADMHEKLNN